MNSYTVVIASTEAVVSLFLNLDTVRKIEQYVKRVYPGFKIIDIKTTI
jgi:hypothetical protein